MYYLNNEEEYLRNNNSNFFDPETGYIKGNMDKTSYYNYRKYEPKKLDLNSEKEKLLYTLSMYYFASHDLKLHLDLNPNDKQVVKKYQEYVKEYKKYKEQYTSKYGPICSLDNNGEVFDYIKCPWPWEVNK
jgi:spore coat protein JB